MIKDLTSNNETSKNEAIALTTESDVKLGQSILDTANRLGKTGQDLGIELQQREDLQELIINKQGNLTLLYENNPNLLDDFNQKLLKAKDIIISIDKDLPKLIKTCKDDQDDIFSATEQLVEQKKNLTETLYDYVLYANNNSTALHETEEELQQIKQYAIGNQTLVEQFKQYAKGNKTLWQGAEQDYTALHKKCQITSEKLSKFESSFNQTKEELNLQEAKTKAEEAEFEANYTALNQTLVASKANGIDLAKELTKLNEQNQNLTKTLKQSKKFLAKESYQLNSSQEALKREVVKEADLESHLANNENQIKQLEALGYQNNTTNPSRHHHLAQHNANNTANSLPSQNGWWNNDSRNGALAGGAGASLLFVVGALLHYKFSNKKPLFQQTIDELVDREALALIKFMDEKMKDPSGEVGIKESIIKIFDPNFTANSNTLDKWNQLSKSFLGIYGPENGTKYSGAYKKLFDYGNALNSLNAEDGFPKIIEEKDNIHQKVENLEGKPIILRMPENKIQTKTYSSLIAQFKTK